ncbi:glycosyltransferase family 39 protein [Gloeobacter kilaueensis]|uniref:Glycosyltransferase RgtA/B/C/D-like domain-containing protein n=1 Tax=Gloeobacter kilaueensis (strain ATCC BAA-2537 / CCAP 1431/1 / ULC 316 / JS1) TaxID=1183438 RepID=U5QLR3_GLOK1|nr:glycosyltransferase family 39 protein [Gloeobacter kilaueensis]AGY58630.1 hypothetical protein GKIL_2384 [Gloeobacter kilaueensis JS1]
MQALRTHWPYLLVAILIGAASRFLGLDLQSLWLDELYSVVASSSASLGEVFERWLFPDTHPPGYQVLLYFWFKLFGDSEVSARSLSAIAGVLAIFAIYRFARPLFGPFVATSAAILTACAYPTLFYAQEARSYSLLFLGATLATLAWLGLICGDGKRNGAYVLYTLCAIFTAYLHYFGFILVLFQILYLFWLVWYRARRGENWGSWWKLGAISLAFAVAYAPWIVAVWLHGGTRAASGLGRIQWVHPPSLLGIFTFLDFLFFKNLFLSALVVVLLVVVPLLVQGSRWSWPERLDTPHLALAALVVGIYLVVFLVSQRVPILIHRNLIVLAPAVYLLVALWLERFHWLKGYRQNALMLGLCVAGFLVMAPGYYRPQKEQWREAVHYAVENTDSRTAVRVLNEPEFFNYYFARFGRLPPQSVQNNIGSLKQLYRQLEAEHGRLLILASAGRELVADGREFLQAHARQRSQKQFIGAVVYEFSFD